MMPDIEMRQPIIYPLPPHLLTNPYLDLLYGSMDGMEVEIRRARPRYALPMLLLGHGPRVLHLHFFDELILRPGLFQTIVRSLMLLALLAALRLRGVCLVWTAHNLAPHEPFHPTWAFLVYRCVARWSDAIIAHSRAAQAAIESRHGRLPRCRVIPHGNYIGRYGPPRERRASRHALGLPLGGRVLLYLGTLRPYKGVENLLDAFAALPERERGVLVIAGQAKDRKYAAELEHKAQAIPNVHMDQRLVPDDEIAAYLAAADVVVLPYQAMLTSGALLWALSYARPVVAPAFGAVRELVREGREGFLFTPGDHDGLRAALERALAHPDLDALGQSALQVARRFAWPEIAAATVACYRHAFRSRQP